MYPSDETVRLRQHKDGSLTILNRDGTLILDHITRSRLRDEDDPRREMRGIALGMFLGLVGWGVILTLFWLFTR
jgi:hypothetical protein